MHRLMRLYRRERRFLMKVVVLAGGISTERDVSLSSGMMIYHALKESGHQVVLLDVYLGYEGDQKEIFERGMNLIAQIDAVKEEDPDLEAVKKLRPEGWKGFFGPGVLEICGSADCVFLALHGANGEDGRIQACFDLMGIPIPERTLRAPASPWIRESPRISSKPTGFLLPRGSGSRRGQQSSLGGQRERRRLEGQNRRMKGQPRRRFHTPAS